MALTKKQIQRATYPHDPSDTKAAYLMDDEPRGFGVRIFPSGRKVYCVRYRTKDGRRRYQQIGDYPTLTLDEARDLARETLGRVAKGEDPADERKETLSALSVGDLCLRFVEEYAREHRPGSLSEDERRISTHILPAWRGRLARSISAEDARRLHTIIGERSKTDANRTIELVRRIWNLALQWGALPAGTLNPATAVTRYKERSRERFLSKREAARLLSEVDRYGRESSADVRESVCARIVATLRDQGAQTVAQVAERVGHPQEQTVKLLASLVSQGRARRIDTGVYEHCDRDSVPDERSRAVVRVAIWLYLLTGARKRELLRARWVDLDRERGRLRLPVTKSGKPHEVPLGGFALALLDELPRIEGNPYIFAGRVSGSHVVNIDKAFQKIRAKAGVEDVRIHDLRRTVGSWRAAAGDSLPQIGALLNHADSRTTQIYARFGEDPMRDSVLAHERELLGVAGYARAEEET